MKYSSTRGADQLDLLGALEQGIASDGGLFLPDHLPEFSIDNFDGCDDAASVAQVFLAPFFEGSALEPHLAAICSDTFSFDLPLRGLQNGTDERVLYLLELFHGPTAAFKDVGARFLASCLSQAREKAAAEDPRPLLILVATSGDTGGAVAAAFHRRPGFEVAVLFPEGRVSSRQQHQLTCWGDNVSAFSVRGAFDDCQSMVKAAFADPQLTKKYRLSSANSINIGRLLPQCVYYALSSLLHWRQHERPLSFVIPSGNLGNGLAALLARSCGLPIADLVFASNANKTIPEFVETGEYQPRPSVATLASAMDVGAPSNLERLMHLHGDAQHLRESLFSLAVDDEQIRAALKQIYAEHGLAVCPHTATAFVAMQRLPTSRLTGRDWALVATADAAKFEDVVEPVIGTQVPVPPSLQSLLDRPAEFEQIDAGLAPFAQALEQKFSDRLG